MEVFLWDSTLILCFSAHLSLKLPVPVFGVNGQLVTFLDTTFGRTTLWLGVPSAWATERHWSMYTFAPSRVCTLLIS